MAGGHNRVLVADSDEEVLQTLGALLTRAGYDVSIARSGQQALCQLRSRNFDLLLLGDYMEDGGWVELFRVLLCPGSKTQCIVMYTAMPGSRDVERLCALGVYELVQRLRPNEIAESIRRFFTEDRNAAIPQRPQVGGKNEVRI